MWALIDIAKRGRSIVLTTHSMEEADALCGRIGIMAYGRLRCLGPSLHLKRRFGDGFRIEVTYATGMKATALGFMLKLLPSARWLTEANGGAVGSETVTLQVADGEARLSELFAHMEARPATAGIVHWSLRQPSLEEVPSPRSNRPQRRAQRALAIRPIHRSAASDCERRRSFSSSQGSPRLSSLPRAAISRCLSPPWVVRSRRCPARAIPTHLWPELPPVLMAIAHRLTRGRRCRSR